MSEPKKLFLLDAFALIYRSYYAFIKNPRINSKGMNTSAVFGFINTLNDVIKKEKPTHIAVVFDSPQITNRAVEFTDYKANREEMPEDIRSCLPYIKKVIEAYNIPMPILGGYEADDIIGTMAKEAERKGFITYMMTPDKDFGQLVSENIFMYRPGRGGKPAEKWGVPEICEKFEVENPLQVIDILGLWGDAADNIPGIPGIGEKTSKKLVAKYGSIEGLIANAEELKGKQKENVINYAEQGLLSKKLATIILDVPIEFNAQELEYQEPNKEALMELFSELEFRNLAQRMFGADIPVKAPAPNSGDQMDLFGHASPEEVVTPVEETKTIKDFKIDYQLVQTKEERAKLIEIISAQKEVCFDTETTGLDPLLAEMVGMSFSIEKNKAYYVTVPENQEEVKLIVEEFKPIFENENITKIAQNIKYDLAILKNYGVDVKGKYYDTMVAHYLIQPDMRHGMDILAETYLNYKPISIETILGKKGKKQLSMRDVTPEQVKDYASEDADITLQLKNHFESKTNEDHLKSLFEDIEMPLISVLADMEREGINLDKETLAKFSIELDEEIKTLHAKIIELAGEEFNVDSPKQLGVILFDVLELDAKAKKTKTGQYSTSEDVLSKLANKHEIIPLILDYRSYRKLKSTYVDALPELINPNTNRLHTTYLQTVAATGRLSSNNPNLQNIPIKTAKGREIRKAFIPRDENHVLLAADYSQIELRIIAAVSGDETMTKSFNAGEDIHSATAAKVFGIKINEVTREQRGQAKAVNFGILYGQSAFGLAQKLNIKRKEAKAIIDSYFEQFSSIRSYIDKMQATARENGYVETIMNRRRYLKDINSNNAIVRGHAERNAINAPIQGSAADIIKVAMINIHKALKEGNFKTKMLLQVHDELVFDVPKNEVEDIKTLVKTNMENAVKLSVPLEVEMETASNWLEAH